MRAGGCANSWETTMSTDNDLDARLSAAGERWRAANKSIADVDLGYLEIPAEPVDVPVTSAGDADGGKKPRHRMRVLIAAGAGVAAAAAATVIAVSLNNSPAKPHPAAGGIGANGLVGVDWRLVKVVGVAPTPTRVQAQEPRLTIDGKGQLAGSDGCNSLGSHVTMTSNTVNVGPVVSTDMACVDAGAAARAARIDALLAGTLQWSVRSNELTLSRNGKAVLVYRAAPAPTTDPKALIAGKWQLDSVAEDGPNGTASTVPAGAALTFDGHGGFTASDGCNSGGGQVAVATGTLVISKYISTKMACPGSQSGLVSKIFDGSLTWSIKDGQLTLTKDGVGSLTYQPAGNGSTPTTGSS
jgi:heat shock protein HslJ